MAAESRRCASHGEAAPSIDHIRRRAWATETAEVFSAISAANAYAVGRSSSSGTTRETRRPVSASAASKSRPVATHSIACEMPTTRGRNQLDAASGTRPRRANTKPKRADSPAIRMSAGSVIVEPTPTAGPLTATMTGFTLAAIRSATHPPPSRGAPSMVPKSVRPPSRPAARWSNVDAPPARSAPAQNPRPAPVTTTALTVSSASVTSNAAISSSAMMCVKAFSRSGRCRVMVATWSAIRSWTCVKSVPTSVASVAR